MPVEEVEGEDPQPVKKRATRSTAIRSRRSSTVAHTNARTARKHAPMASGFQISTDAQGATPSAVSPPETATSGWM